MTIKVYHIKSEALQSIGYASFRSPEFLMRLWEGGNYQLVATVNSGDLDVAYELTNNIDNPWVTNENVEPVGSDIKRSTMVGDILEIVESGEKYVCATAGWDRVYLTGDPQL